MKNNKQLTHENQRLVNIINATGIGTWEWDIQSNKIFFNESWAQIIGYSTDELGPSVENWNKFVHEEDLELVEKEIQRVFSKEIPYYEKEFRMKHKNGKWIWVLDKGKVVTWSPKGEPLLMMGSHTDITYIKAQADALLSTKTLLKSSLESSEDIIILAIDINYNYLYFNNAHKKSMKHTYNIDINIGMNLLDCITSKKDKIDAKTNFNLALSGTSHTTRKAFTNADVIVYESHYNPIYDKEGKIIGATTFALNITELTNANQKFKESEEKLKLVLDSTTSGIFSVDKDNICTYVNKGTLKLLGYENEDEFLGKNMHDLIHHSYADNKPHVQDDCFLFNAIKEGKIINQDDIIWRKDGKHLPVTYASFPQIKNKEYIGAVVTFANISEKNKLIKNLNYERNLAQMYLDVAGVMIIVLDNNGVVTLINKKGCQILEVDEKEIIGKNWFDNFLPESDVKTVKTFFENVFTKQDEMITNVENEILLPSGRKKMIKWYNSILYDINNKIIGVISSGQDITKNKRDEMALIESNLRFQRLYNKAPIGYQSLDINGNFLEVNQTWLDLLGYQKEEVVGKWFGDFLTFEYQETFKKRFEYFKQVGKIRSSFEMLHKQGRKIFIEFEGMIGYDDDNQFKQTYCTLNDITERKKIQDQLEKSENSLKLAQSIAKIGSWELDLRNNTLWASKEAFNIYEINSDSGITDLASIQKMVDNPDRKILDQALSDLINHNKTYNVTFKLNTMTKAIKYINSKASLFRDIDNKPLRVIGVIHDITEVKQKEIELEYINNHDYLTGLYNRRFYFEQFNKLDKTEYYPLGMMMLDVNGLKIVNDAFGHTVGDQALKMLGTVLQDVFDKKDIVSRIGGDEFTVLCPNTSEEELEAYKRQIGEIVKTKKIQNIELSLAIGYELKKSVDEDIDEIQKLAENHMYRHKTTEGSSVRSRAVNAILVTLTNKYAIERKHSAKVSKLCKQIGLEMNLRDDEVKELEQAGLFHDIGKISIPDSILNKPGKLTFEEFEIIKTHTEIGYQILRAADEYSDLAIHALHHHERWDGKGYPRGLSGTDIPLFSRIICITDAYEAMTTDRPYRKRLSKEYAVSEIIKCSGAQFDPDIAKLFVEKILKETWQEPS